MLTLCHRPVRLPDGKIIHRNVSTKNRSLYWIRYKNDWYQVKPDDRTVDVEYTGFPFILIDDTRPIRTSERAILEAVFDADEDWPTYYERSLGHS